MFILSLELGDPRREVDAMQAPRMFFDLFHASLGE